MLVGHSQGALLLKDIIAAEIDGKPLAAQLVGAILAGGNVEVPEGKDVGGSFATIPLCRAAGQTRCVIAYSSFLAGEPPGERAPFGAASRSGLAVTCVDPAVLDGSRAALDAVLPLVTENAEKAKLDTPFFTVPGLLTGHCVTGGERSYLALPVGQGARAGAVARLFQWPRPSSRARGLHALDLDIAMGNLVDIVESQSRASTARHGMRCPRAPREALNEVALKVMHPADAFIERAARLSVGVTEAVR